MATNVATQVTNKLPCGRVIVATIQPRADGGWVVTHQDVSERETLNAQLARQNELLKQREEELNAQNERFNAAINNMSQGMSLFDSEQRVVFANRRFAEIYGLAPEEVRPGTTLRQILTARAARGVYNNVDAAKFVEEGVASFGEAMSHIVQLADGRFISVVRRPMADGGRCQHARGRERAREALCAPGCAKRHLAPAGGGAQGAERALRHGLEEHVARPLHVRRQPAGPDRQSSLCRDLRADARSSKTRHDAAADCRSSHRPRALRRRQSRGVHQGPPGKVRRGIGRGASPQRRTGASASGDSRCAAAAGSRRTRTSPSARSSRPSSSGTTSC